MAAELAELFAKLLKGLKIMFKARIVDGFEPIAEMAFDTMDQATKWACGMMARYGGYCFAVIDDPCHDVQWYNNRDRMPRAWVEM